MTASISKSDSCICIKFDGLEKNAVQQGVETRKILESASKKVGPLCQMKILEPIFTSRSDVLSFEYYDSMQQMREQCNSENSSPQFQKVLKAVSKKPLKNEFRRGVYTVIEGDESSALPLSQQAYFLVIAISCEKAAKDHVVSSCREIWNSVHNSSDVRAGTLMQAKKDYPVFNGAPNLVLTVGYSSEEELIANCKKWRALDAPEESHVQIGEFKVVSE